MEAALGLIGVGMWLGMSENLIRLDHTISGAVWRIQFISEVIKLSDEVKVKRHAGEGECVAVCDPDAGLLTVAHWH